MAIKDADLVGKINEYFDNASYSELHVNDIWFTIIIFLVVILIALYFFITSTIKSYKTSWSQNKCNPLLMPFASIINSEESRGDELNYIINNFNECLNTLNAELTEEAKIPINKLTSSIEGIFGSIYESFIQIQEFFAYLSSLLLELVTMIMSKLNTILINVKYFFINVNDLFGRVLSMFTVVYYTLILLLRALRLIIVVFVLGWLLTVVIPASMMTLGLIKVVTILLLTIIILNNIPGFGQLIILFVLAILIPIYGSYILSLVFLIIVLILYALFNDFANKTLYTK